MNAKVKAKLERVQSLNNFVEGTQRKFYECHEPGRDEAGIDVSNEEKIVLHSWLESGHNGAAFDSKSRELNDEESEVILDHIILTLEARAVKIVLDMEERESRQAREDKAKQRLETLLVKR